jgi:hypothetical protein
MLKIEMAGIALLLAATPAARPMNVRAAGAMRLSPARQADGAEPS